MTFFLFYTLGVAREMFLPDAEFKVLPRSHVRDIPGRVGNY
jgi:hypothetical protein